MAQVRYRANLSAKDFVYSSQDWGRSVVLKQYDQNFSRQIVSPTDPDKDIGIPQIFYCHNVMPRAQGFQSVGIANKVPSVVGGTNFAFQTVEYTDTPSGNSGQLLFVASGSGTYSVYACPHGSFAWTYVTAITDITNYLVYRIQVANVQGQTYILIPCTGCYTFDGTSFTNVTLTGLTISTIIGITASYGYMIAWSAQAVAWSSTITPTDFTPSEITGAGGGGITALKGFINLCQHHTFGFIIFSSNNCVAAVYSGNAKYPFNFREIIAGGGIDVNQQLADLDSESGNLYGWTNSGLQIVSVTQAQGVFAELTNFIGGSRFEDFNDTTLQFSETDIALGGMYKQVNVISNRYLVISYGIISQYQYTHALVYDITMKRWGKIKHNHCQVFQWPNLAVDQQARSSIGFLDQFGAVDIVDFSYSAPSLETSTIILGKYQHARDRTITLLSVDLEYAVSNNATLHLLSTLDGKTFQAPVAIPQNPLSTGVTLNFPMRKTGVNHTLVIQGQFFLDSLMLTYIPNGRR